MPDERSRRPDRGHLPAPEHVRLPPEPPRGSALDLANRIDKLTAIVARAAHPLQPPPLPPMRPPSDSTHDVADRAGQDVAAHIARESSPPGSTSQARIAVIVTEAVQREVQRTKDLERAEASARVAAEKADAEARVKAERAEAARVALVVADQRAADRRAHKNQLIAGVIAIILAVIGSYAAGVARMLERRIDPTGVAQ
jgi:hypothetical protein